MNILFISDSQPIPTHGGIARVIYNLMQAFSKVGIDCNSAYFNKIDESINDGFTVQTELSADNFIEELSRIINDRQIQIVLNCVIYKSNIQRTLLSSSVLENQNPNTKFVYCFHNYPGFESRTLPIRNIIAKMLYSQERWTADFPLLCRSLSNTLCPGLTRKLLKNKYRVITNHAQNIVLLSESYKRDLAKIVGMKEVPNEWIAIGNALSFSNNIELNENNKEKTVLIVSRMDEEQKRLSVALKIWNELCLKYKVSDWKLVFLGEGIDRPVYEKIVAKKKIPNVFFEGRQDSLPYYIKSSIFMMTSAYEGFPMTLLETMQCGCVPIAFDSFSAINDLIENGENGFIIDNGNNKRYIEHLYLLMKDTPLRKKMALSGMQSVQQYSIENITQQWYDLFDKLSV